MRRLKQMLLALLLCSTAVAPSYAQVAPRGSAVPLSSVGKLHVPGQRYENGYAKHFDESCSATLITDSPLAQSSELIISAWHCLEFYRDTSKALTFQTSNGETRKANLLSSGGSMYSDWALLRLDAPLPSPAVLTSPNSTHTNTVRMAGYPRLAAPQIRLKLTVSDCQVTGSDDADTRSDCVLQKGASGGAVFSRNNEERYLGVISRGDGESLSIYVPLARFRANISGYLENYQLP
ncbi:serine protease [Congregibacter variabilis]|uniref:Serine protease n=1 Tax=Congregibacter variabilis TaxID=3081200 RepID=A0ABZ0I4F0_9GAMM|nr:serine protease [Congregibacter sp. IMCC43200]